MSVRLALICHAATAATRSAAFSRDEPLDAQGLIKAASVCTLLRRVDHAMTSPTLRTRQTAAALRLEASVEPMLADLDYGRWAGRSMEAVEADEPGALSAWTTDPTTAPHGGESVAALIARIASWLDGMTRMQGRVVAVAHPSTLRAALVLALGAHPQAFWRIDVGPLCRLEMYSRGGVWTLRSLGLLQAERTEDDRTVQSQPDPLPS